MHLAERVRVPPPPLLLLLQFVAHPNCQQHLTSIWYGQQMGFMQSLTLWKQLGFWLVCIVLLPVICFIYIVAPNTQVCKLTTDHILTAAVSHFTPTWRQFKLSILFTLFASLSELPAAREDYR